MPPSFQIPTTTRAAMADALEAIYEALKAPVKLHYPPSVEPCPNCVLDPFSNTSSGRYQPGGPQDFEVGLCPVCNGVGWLTTASSELSTAVVARSPADFKAVKLETLNVPAGSILIKFRAVDLEKYRRAQTIEVRPDNPLPQEYAPAGEPVDSHNFVPGVYFHMLFSRVVL